MLVSFRTERWAWTVGKQNGMRLARKYPYPEVFWFQHPDPVSWDDVVLWRRPLTPAAFRMAAEQFGSTTAVNAHEVPDNALVSMVDAYHHCKLLQRNVLHAHESTVAISVTGWCLAAPTCYRVGRPNSPALRERGDGNVARERRSGRRFGTRSGAGRLRHRITVGTAQRARLFRTDQHDGTGQCAAIDIRVAVVVGACDDGPPRPHSAAAVRRAG